jgi:hypothetical protein
MGIYEVIVLLALVWIISIPFWIVSIIDIARSRFRANDKTVWLLVVGLLSLPGIILYRVIGKKQKIVS